MQTQTVDESLTNSDAVLSAALERIARLTAQAENGGPVQEASPVVLPVNPAENPLPAPAKYHNTFMPIEPASFQDAGLTDSEVESLILKFLLGRGDATGREIADQVKLSFIPVSKLLSELKTSQLVIHRGSAPMNDFQYQLSDLGARARAEIFAILHLFSRGARLPDRLHRQRPGPIVDEPAPHAGGLAPRVRGTAAERQDARSAWTRNQFGPWAVFVRTIGQRQDEHRRADYPGLRVGDLASPRDQHRRRDYPHLRPHQP